MPDEEKKTVDIDTSGTDATIDIEETKDEAVIERPEENKEQETDKSFENEREIKLEEKKDDENLEDYSKGVQARIAKLTRKMREAERREQAAMDEPINPDPRAEAWAAKNSWFGTDRAMTYTAFEIHKDLTEKEGYDPNSEEYYAEVDKRIRVDFPHKFGNTETKQSTAPVQTVASANRSVKPGRKTVRLTSSQVAIAKKLGVPLEEYAKQLKNTEGA